jgi:hypothetical protein
MRWYIPALFAAHADMTVTCAPVSTYADTGVFFPGW